MLLLHAKGGTGKNKVGRIYQRLGGERELGKGGGRKKLFGVW